ALMPDRVLTDLHEHRVSGGQRLFDASWLSFGASSLPIDLAGVEDGVSSLTDVDEGGFHRGQHVLHPAQVHVADHGSLLALGDIVLDEDVIFEDGDLGAAFSFAYHHGTVDRLAPGQDLGFGDERAAPPGVAALPAS